MGANAHARRVWVSTIMKDNEKKHILAIQTFRNTIMGLTLMATTSIVWCCGLAAVLSSSYSVKKQLSNSILGAHGQFMVALKFIGQVNYLINCPEDSTIVTTMYVSEILEKDSNKWK
ncbi:hypothetical protein M8C21_013906, partial [Ambrosia artemisiifolia]